MATLRIEIQMDNAAFSDGDEGAEVARILRKMADDCETYGECDDNRALTDYNGNKVGTQKVFGR